MLNLLGHTYGQLTVIEYLGKGTQKRPQAMWRCFCTCGSTDKIVQTRHLRSGTTKDCGCVKRVPDLDLSGQQFGFLTVLEYALNGKYKCRCACGEFRRVCGSKLRESKIQSCGCKRAELFSAKTTLNLIGRQFGRLLVKAKEQSVKHRTRWNCLCSCGSETLVYTSNLLYGRIKSCGCIHIETMRSPEKVRERCLKAAKTISKNSQELIHWKTGGPIYCLGSYEVAVVKYLNTNLIDFEWQIPFKLSNGRIYIVDLFLKEDNKYVEIKGYMRPKNKIKWELFLQMKPHSELWTKEVLKTKGIL